MKLKIMDYAHREYYAQDVPLEDVERVRVKVVSGDEILTIQFKDGETRILDVADVNDDHRLIGFYDGEYSVSNKELADWNNRKDTYEWLWR